MKADIATEAYQAEAEAIGALFLRKARRLAKDWLDVLDDPEQRLSAEAQLLTQLVLHTILKGPGDGAPVLAGVGFAIGVMATNFDLESLPGIREDLLAAFDAGVRTGAETINVGGTA